MHYIITHPSPHFFEYVYQILQGFDANRIKIGLLGVAYGPGIADTRFSPVEDFYTRITKCFPNVSCHDPFVNHWEEIDIKIENSLEEFLSEDYDALIITTAHREYVNNGELYEIIYRKEIQCILIDTVGLLDFEKLPKSFIWNQNFFVLGVGHREG